MEREVNGPIVRIRSSMSCCLPGSSRLRTALLLRDSAAMPSQGAWEAPPWRHEAAHRAPERARSEPHSFREEPQLLEAVRAHRGTAVDLHLASRVISNALLELPWMRPRAVPLTSLSTTVTAAHRKLHEVGTGDFQHAYPHCQRPPQRKWADEGPG